MQYRLTGNQEQHFLKRGFTRRSFGRIATLIGAGATLPFFNEGVMAQLSQVRGMPPDAVKINSNENPMGPCAEAIAACHEVVHMGGRYSYELTDEFRETLAAQSGLTPDYVQPFAGSSAPLIQTAIAFTSPTRSWVTADPGYESGQRAAEFIGAKVYRVPLGKNATHDVKGMVAADSSAGVLYICNPNNPTGSITPTKDIEWALANKPEGSIILLDEAYIHFSGEPMRTDLVAQDKDIIILRTFSKIYGMAGLRAGAAIGRPDLLAKITPYSGGALPITGVKAATASLKADGVVEERRKIVADIRADVLAFLDKHGFSYAPTVSNKFMVDTGKPANDVIMAMRKEKVYIGRPWSSWPTHVRVTIGTAEEMEKFKAAFLKVMAA